MSMNFVLVVIMMVVWLIANKVFIVYLWIKNKELTEKYKRQKNVVGIMSQNYENRLRILELGLDVNHIKGEEK